MGLLGVYCLACTLFPFLDFLSEPSGEFSKLLLPRRILAGCAGRKVVQLSQQPTTPFLFRDFSRPLFRHFGGIGASGEHIGTARRQTLTPEWLMRSENELRSFSLSPLLFLFLSLSLFLGIFMALSLYHYLSIHFFLSLSLPLSFSPPSIPLCPPFPLPLFPPRGLSSCSRKSQFSSC